MSTVSAGTGRLPAGELLRASTVAKALGVHRSTVHRWAAEKDGPLKDGDFTRIGPGRSLRIRREAAQRLLDGDA